jgi:hypothetical protein
MYEVKKLNRETKAIAFFPAFPRSSFKNNTLCGLKISGEHSVSLVIRYLPSVDSNKITPCRVSWDVFFKKSLKT